MVQNSITELIETNLYKYHLAIIIMGQLFSFISDSREGI